MGEEPVDDDLRNYSVSENVDHLNLTVVTIAMAKRLTISELMLV